MSVTSDIDQQEWQRTVRDFFAAKSPESEVRRLAETPAGYDPEVWRQLGDQLGVHGLIVPEEYGGSGFGFVELGAVLEEMGRNLFCGPFLSSAVIAAAALLATDDAAAKARYLPGIAEGVTIATLAVAEDGPGLLGATTVGRAVADGGGWRVSGGKRFVTDGHLADLVLVVANVEGRLGLFAVQASAEGVRQEALQTMDQTRRLAHLSFSDTPAERIGVQDLESLLERVQSVGAACVAAEQVGGMQQALDLAVEYAKVRIQYGRPIGSFQAIKHRCADMLVAVEGARAVAAQALAALDRDDQAVTELTSLAKVCASESYLQVAGDSIQIHGGIGVTWEHPIHLYFKRAKASALLWGAPGEHRARIAAAIGI